MIPSTREHTVYQGVTGNFTVPEYGILLTLKRAAGTTSATATVLWNTKFMRSDMKWID
jgi:hypothetical protein